MTVFGGLQFGIVLDVDASDYRVSIPMTVFGGLQSEDWDVIGRHQQGFNTDDGIWRAAIVISGLLDMEVPAFQYR